MYDIDPTIRSLEIGEAIRQRLHALGVSGVEVATHLGWTPSKLSRLLTGKRTVSDTDVAKMIGYCGVRHDLADYLLRLAADRHRTDPLILPAHQRTVVDYPALAVNTVAYCPDTLPVELTDLNHALWQQNWGTKHAIYYLAENLLHDRTDADHGARLHALLQLSLRTYLTLRCVRPDTLPAHVRGAESFTLFRFYDLAPTVELHTHTMTLYLNTPTDITAYTNLLRDIEAGALPESGTRALLLRHAAEAGSPLTEDTPIPAVAGRAVTAGTQP